MKINWRRHEDIYQAIEQHPGLTAGQLARAARLSRDVVRSALPAMEQTGHLIFEDEEGRLWPFGKTRIGR